LASGVVGAVQVSQVATGQQNYRRAEIHGSEGSLAMEEDRNLGPEVRLSRRGETRYTPQPVPAALDVAFDDFPRFHVGRVVAALRGEPSDFPTFEDGLKAQLVVDAVEQSLRTGRWVTLAS
jgi:predicted dehydrogenase